MERKFWRIECEEGIKKISSLIVSTGQITDKAIGELMKILFSKHILLMTRYYPIYVKKVL
jgi:hypothetical protein